jgi:hypothetical protein
VSLELRYVALLVAAAAAAAVVAGGLLQLLAHFMSKQLCNCLVLQHWQ